MKKYGLLTLKIIGWLSGIIICLILLAFFLIRLPGVQDFARKKTVNYLENKLKTKVEINRVSFDFPNLVLEDVYFEDQKRDTLLAGDTLKVNISWLKLFDNILEVNEIDFRGITANVQRSLPDSAFNFDYIIKAFVLDQAKKVPSADSVAAIKFILDKINLDRININYQDNVRGSDVHFKLSHFDTRIKELDLEKMRVNIPAMRLEGLTATIYQHKPIIVKAVTNENTPSIIKTSPETPSMDLSLGTIDLSKVKLDYRNDITAINTQLDLGKLIVQINKIDIKNQDMLIKSVVLTDTKTSLGLGEVAQEALKNTGETIANEAEKGWTVHLDDIAIKNNDLKYDDLGKKRLALGMDFFHLDIKNLNTHAQNISYNPKETSGKIIHLSMTERSGLDLKELRGDLLYGSEEMYLKNMYVQTSRSVLKNNIRLTYNSMESLAANPGNTGVDVNLNGGRIGFRDVLLFVPELASVDPFRKNPNLFLNVNGIISGKVNDLRLPGLDISGLTNTRIKMSGRIRGLPDMNNAVYNLQISQFSSGSRDLDALVSRGVIPANIRLPQTFTLSGNFNGSANNFSTNLNLTSSYGSARTIASMRGSSYNADIGMVNFNVGRLIKQEATTGRFTGVAKINGSGFNPKTMRAAYSINAQKAEVYGYSYRNLTASGNIINQNFTAIARLDDPNARLSLNATANLGTTFPAVTFTLDVDSANLQALKLYSQDLRVHGKVVGDLSSTDPDRLIGAVDASNLIVAFNSKRYQLDSIAFDAAVNGDQRDLRIRSQILTGNLSGKYKLTEVGQAFINEINKYFKTDHINSKALTAPQDFSFAVHVNNHPLLQQFIPSLTNLRTSEFKGNLNSTTGTLNITGNVPQLTYMGYSVNNLYLDVNTAGDALNYLFNFDQAGTARLQVNQTTLKGKAQNNQLDVNLTIKDAGDKDRYQLAGLFTVNANQYQFSFNQNGLMLNYDQWAVSPGNALKFGPAGILAQNFELSRAGQRLSINSNPQALNAPLSVGFTNFRIETITSFAQKDTLLAGGIINGNALVSNFGAAPIFTADLNIKDFNFRTDTLGDVSLKINNSLANTYAVNVQITGKGNDLALDGVYYIKPQNGNNFDLNVTANNINLASIEGFTLGYIRNASGSIDGNFKISGTLTAPVLRGDLNFKQAAFNIAMLNSYYSIPNDRISFTSDGIVLDNFTMLDSLGNEAVVNGIIYTKYYTDYDLDLTVNTDHFRVLNSTKKDNHLFYGTVYVSSDLDLKGNMTSPSINGSVQVNEGTTFTIVLPQNDPAVQEREGIVEFIDIDDAEAMTAFATSPDSLNNTDIRGLNLAVNIEIDSTSIFNVVIDEGNGDYVEVQGQAELSAGVDPSGKISLTGNYELAKGAYEMSYNFIKRRFQIERGSTITWTGEPTAANLNVAAIYLSNTAPLGLVDNQLGSITATERNRYKQKLPFEVYLSLKGELLKPEITFDIDLPPNGIYNVSRDVLNTVDIRLTQLRNEPNELNKQVFSLLLLNRFTSENPFDNEAGGGGIQAFVRQSVSNILTEQLNSLAGNLIQGVDLNFDLVSSEDYTTGSLKNRTDLNVSFSKQLLNERLKITIGNNFELEGPHNANQPASGIAGNIALDYQLSSDGRYLLRAYRKNVSDAIIEGYVIETGLGFIMTMDYNKFKELFVRRTEEDKLFKKDAKEKRKDKNKKDRQTAKTES